MPALAATQDGGSIWPPLFMIGLLLGAVIVGVIAVWLIRTRLFGGRSDRSLLEALRRMREEGHLSEEEYRVARGSAARREREQIAREADDGEEAARCGNEGGP